MAIVEPTTPYRGTIAGDPTVESNASAISWGAVLAGAFAATGVALILTAFGGALGLSILSPWRGEGASAGTFTVATAIGLIVVQWLSAALGGYTAGRLRTKWSNVHSDEVYFRDTAHGYLSWAVGAVVGAVLLTMAATSVIGGAAKAVGGVAAGAAAGAAHGAATAGADGSLLSDYSLDTLLRPALQQAAAPGTAPAGASPTTARGPEARQEASRILINSVKNGSLSEPDKNYLVQMVATNAGIPVDQAQARVNQAEQQLKEAEQKAREAADAARKATAYASLFTGFAMLIGAFIASAAAALGGLHRDEY